MPRHAFKFPSDVVAAVKQHVANAIEAVDPQRFGQEPNYTAALVSRMQGTAYEGTHGSVVFTSTVFDDRGRNAAEHRYGADHAITATISDGIVTIRKVIVVQAKLGRIEELSAKEGAFLRNQIEKMRQLVPAPKVMEIPKIGGRRFPSMVSGNRVLNGERYTPMGLPDYFAARVTTTLDGCTNPVVVSDVQDSSLTRVDVRAKIRRV